MSNQGSTGFRGNRGDGRGRGRGRGWPQGQSQDQGQSRGRGRGRGSPGPSSPPAEIRGGFRGRGTRGSDTGGRAVGGRGFRGGYSRGAPSHAQSAPAPAGPVTIPARLSEQSLQDLMDRFRSLSVDSGPEQPLRPGYGTKGTAIKVHANFFPIKLPKGPFFDYAVKIERKPRLWERKQLFKLLVDSPEMAQYRPHIAHDNDQRLVSAKPLPEDLSINIPLHEDGDKPTVGSTMFTISILPKGELDLNQIKDFIAGKPESRTNDIQLLVGALDLILQAEANYSGYRVGKNRFFIPSRAERWQFGPGIEAFQGFYLSVRPAYKELLVNVNVAVTAFFQPGNLAEAMKAFGVRSSGGSITLPPGYSDRLKIVVKTLHLGHRKKIKSVGTMSARRTKFRKSDGELITIEDYFLEAYNKKLKYPDELPVVDLSGPNSLNPAWTPAELCEIPPGQPLFDLSKEELAQMIRVACNPPAKNRDTILNRGLPTLGLAPLRPPMDGFGVEVSNEMSVVPARELPPPTVTYSQRLARVNEASWNFMGEKFHKGASVTRWWVVVVLDGKRRSTGIQDPQIRNLVNEFAQKCRSSGMNISSTGPGNPEYIEISLPPQRGKDRKDAVTLIRNRFSQKLGTAAKPSFALVLLENEDSHVYPAIKRIGDVELGIQTVHILLDKLFRNRRQDQYYSNVALKVNTKLGGINHKLDAAAMAWLKKKPTMMVGVDVTHPGVRAKYGSPSIAAVVANSDDDFVQFPCSIRIQEGRKEMVTQLKEMMIERLQTYERKNKKFPERVFVFRDGVSESQFKQVNEEELRGILGAFASFPLKPGKPAYRPKLSIVVCGKRHHARFYPTTSEHATKNGNTKPGTVVDQGVTAVFDFDFYLQAHAGIQGHVKATHYSVIYDENAFGADEIQQGTHHASYMYARASKAVSLIPPAYYADLACERGRCYLNEFLSFEDPEKNKGRGKGKDRGREEEKKRVFELAKKYWDQGLHPDMRDTMFYI